MWKVLTSDDLVVINHNQLSFATSEFFRETDDALERLEEVLVAGDVLPEYRPTVRLVLNLNPLIFGFETLSQQEVCHV